MTSLEDDSAGLALSADAEEASAPPRHVLGPRAAAASLSKIGSLRLSRRASPVHIVRLDAPGKGATAASRLLEPEAISTQLAMTSGESAVEVALEALRRGSLDCRPKPIQLTRLASILDRWRQHARTSAAEPEERRPFLDLERFDGLIGRSPQMQHLYACIERVAPTQETVLIIGPSGTGKELVAAAIQRASTRRHQPFITVNCGAISSALIESELFGHEKGSFTGADRRRKGLFEQADGGTLFLDEVTEMPIEQQVRLLRVLETGRLTRVGGHEEIAVDVRVLAATNRDPATAVDGGKLRADLLYRLLVFPLQVPALYEHLEDLPMLAQHFLDRLDAEHGSTRRLSAGALAALEGHCWPGNVRELSNTLRRAYIMSRDRIEASDLLMTEPLRAAAPERLAIAEPISRSARGREQVRQLPERVVNVQSGAALDGAEASLELLPIHAGMTIAEAERILIHATLQRSGGNKAAAAQALEISLKTLYARLQVYAAKGA
ncbi:MAG: sigma-54-dependent Fis family transcriptional regulator [Planctomycetes bacterium]|nr:sigma-54-dependent Fis family transcriptional regulator [Planctomycetota bacterium]